jgi:predicted nicotinamide N-methyase
MFSIESFNQTFKTETIPVTIGNKPFTFLVPKNLDEVLDSSDGKNQFPLWVKIWEASLVLADHLAKQNHTSKTLLELGAGLGAIGIVAESFGYQVTATEYDSQALQFLMANAHKNECKTMQIQHLDWHKPDINGTFDIIVGSELIYKEDDFDPLIALFQKYLAPDGQILLANEPRKTYEPFLDILKKWYRIEIWRKRLRASDQTKTILLTRLSGKNNA